MSAGKKHILILLAGVLVIGILLGLFLILSGRETEKKPEETGKVTDDETEIVSRIGKTPVSLTVTRVGDTLSFDYDAQGEKWTCESEPGFPVDPSLLTQRASSLESVRAIRKIGENPGTFGLETPSLIVRITWGTGETDEFVFGLFNKFLNAYYLSCGGTVYTVSPDLYTLFDFSLEDLILLDVYPSSLTESSLLRVTLRVGEKETTIGDEDGLLYIHDDSVKVLSLENWVDGCVTESERKTYGLSEPSAILEITYLFSDTEHPEVGEICEERVFRYVFGRTVTLEGETFRLFSVNDSPVLYQARESVLEDLWAMIDYVPATPEQD